MDSMGVGYHPPESLTILAGIFLALGATCGLIVVMDIIWRRGWNSMMGVMIPTYPITAAYTGPIGLYLYFKFGRAKKPGTASGHDHHHMHSQPEKAVDVDSNKAPSEGHEHHNMSHSEPATIGHSAMEQSHTDHVTMDHSTMNHSQMHHDMDPTTKDVEAAPNDDMQGPHKMGEGLPQWATVLIGVSHCGAGCVLGDLVGEWIVFGAGDTISGHDTWPCLLVDYAFALLFGIFFQYFSIAPMSGEWGPKTLIRAAKADFLSLTSFEIGLFGWMVAYQVGIWNYKLEMTTWVYWWMMMIGMQLGFVTAAPVNWWLLANGIKEPCV